jgi:hypothetical protein
MTQYQFENNTLKLRVKKSLFFIRAIMFFFAFLFFVSPTIAMVSSVAEGKDFHFGFIISIGVFGLMGFYLLRIALWNSFGSEEIKFDKNTVTYVADYAWFKDGLKTLEITPLIYSIKQIGYEEDNIGALIIGEGDQKIESVTKIPVDELEQLIKILKDFN